MLNSNHNRVAAATVLWTVRSIKRFNRNGSQSRGYRDGFTLAEMLVAMAVLAFVVLFVTRLVDSAAAITTLGHKHMDTDAQARQLLHRMAIDFNQMVKRSDVSYFVKTGAGAQVGNDRIAFFSAIPGYYPQSGYKSNIALTAYRVNASSTSASYNKVERMGKGLHFNAGYSNATPLLFLDSATAPNTTIQSIWPAAASATTIDSDYEVAGSQVFRLEYYYLLTTGAFSAGPWTNPSLPAIKDVAAIVVAIAAIDPKSKALLTTANMEKLAGTNGQTSPLVDYTSGWVPGQLLSAWQTALDTNAAALPRPAIQGVRLYERCFYLNQ